MNSLNLTLYTAACGLMLLAELLFVFRIRFLNKKGTLLPSLHILLLVFMLGYLAWYSAQGIAFPNWNEAVLLERLVLISVVIGVVGIFTYPYKKHLYLAVPVSCVSIIIAWALIQKFVKIVSV